MAKKKRDPGIGKLADRVRALEKQLAAAPTAPETPPTPPTTTPPPTEPGDVFWALEGLAARGPDAVLFAGRVATPDGPVQWQITRPSEELLAEDWSARATVVSALAHPVRLRILQLVVSGAARTAADLAGSEGLGSTGQIYHHLRQLVSAGWLTTTVKGRHEVPGERLVPLLTVLSAAR